MYKLISLYLKCISFTGKIIHHHISDVYSACYLQSFALTVRVIRRLTSAAL